MVRVMVVDDHPMWRDAVERDLVAAGFDVVAVAADGHQALARFPAARPQVVVLDLQIPGPNGVEVTAQVLRQDPSARVLILSASGEQNDVLEAVKAGATGYLVKSASRPELLDAVRRVAAGDTVFTPGLAGLVLGEFRRMADGPAADLRIPVKAQPTHGFENRVDVGLLFLFGVGVVEAKVAHAAVVARQPKVQADALGVTDMQIAVGLGREAGANARRIQRARGVVGCVARAAAEVAWCQCAGIQIALDLRAQEVAGPGGG